MRGIHLDNQGASNISGVLVDEAMPKAAKELFASRIVNIDLACTNI